MCFLQHKNKKTQGITTTSENIRFETFVNTSRKTSMMEVTFANVVGP